MHHMKARKLDAQYARAKQNGFHKNPPPTPEEQARIAELVNEMLVKLNRTNVQTQLV